MKRCALLTCADNSDIGTIVRPLVECRFTLMAPHTTRRAIFEADNTANVLQVTGPDVFQDDSNVLNYQTFAGLLADVEGRPTLTQLGMPSFDLLVCCPATPLTQILGDDDRLEEVRFDGMRLALLMAALASPEVAVVCDQHDYRAVAEVLDDNARIDDAFREKLRKKALRFVYEYMARHVDDEVVVNL